MAWLDTHCTVCGAAIAQPAGQGRRRRTCTPACRVKLYRAERHKAQTGRWPDGYSPASPTDAR